MTGKLVIYVHIYKKKKLCMNLSFKLFPCSLREVDEMYMACEEVNAKLGDVKSVGAEHSQVGPSVQFPKNCFLS